MTKKRGEEKDESESGIPKDSYLGGFIDTEEHLYSGDYKPTYDIYSKPRKPKTEAMLNIVISSFACIVLGYFIDDGISILLEGKEMMSGIFITILGVFGEILFFLSILSQIKRIRMK